jgi:hypothetical protein
VLDTDVVSHLRRTGESEPEPRGAGCQCALGEYLRLSTLLELEPGLLLLERRTIGWNDKKCVGQSDPIRDLLRMRGRR